MGWIIDAERRVSGIVEPATIEVDGAYLAAVAFAFQGPDVDPVTCVLVGTEMELRRLQKDLDKAVTAACRRQREQTKNGA
jgi:hypothetical protein